MTTVAPSTWAPLRNRVFRALWIAVLVSNVGTWMQTVGAQWLLVGEPNASTLVALVQTATQLPVFLLALPAGVLADTFDRRHLLIAVQSFQVVVGIVLTATTLAGEMNPPLLLLLTFVLGAGAALAVPAWQALIPELVPRDQLRAASALGSISVNLARALGPAIAGLLVAQVGVAAVFALNAASFALFAAVLLLWRPGGLHADQPERFIPALRAGGRYVRYSPIVRRILLRSALFVIPGSALWALLPLVASRLLHTDASGYGVLLGALGVGAVAGAVWLPRLRTHLSTNRLMLLAGFGYAASMAIVALVGNLAVAALALVPAGVAWMAVLSTVNAAMQLFLPGWVRARGLSAYQIVVFGGQAVGSVLWGVTAGRIGLVDAFLAAAAVMAAGALTVRRWPMSDTSRLDRDPAIYWPEPHLELDPEPDVGPVLVQVTYHVSPENQTEFVESMAWVRRSRLRTGATWWELYRTGEAPNTFVEVYSVASWEEHLRQHAGRLTGYDQAQEEHAVALADGTPGVAHLFPTDVAD